MVLNYLLLLFLYIHISVGLNDVFYDYKTFDKSKRVYKPFLSPIELNIYNGEYVYIIMGNPGIYVKMRLNFELDRTILYNDIESKTMNKKKKSEIVYLDKYKLRIPIDFGYQTDEHEYYENFNVDGKHLINEKNENLVENARIVFDDIEDDDSNILSNVNVVDDDDGDSKYIYSTYVLEKMKQQNIYNNISLLNKNENDKYIMDKIRSDMNIDGELALGPKSMLWKYWCNFTITIDSITFGSYNMYTTQTHYGNVPNIPVYYREMIPEVEKIEYIEKEINKDVFYDSRERKDRLKLIEHILSMRYKGSSFRNIVPYGSFVTFASILGEKYIVVLNYESYSTCIPKKLKRMSGFMIDFLYSNEQQQEEESVWNLYFSVSDHKIMLKDELNYHTIYESPLKNVLIIGKYALKHLTIFYDMKEKTLKITPSYYNFINNPTNYYICSMITILLCTYWLISAAKSHFWKMKDKETVLNALHMICILQICICTFSCISMVVLLYGYKTQEYLYNMIRTNYVYFELLILCFFISLYSICTIYLNIITISRLLRHQIYNPYTEKEKKTLELKPKKWKHYYSDVQDLCGKSVYKKHTIGLNNEYVLLHKIEFIVHTWILTTSIRKFQTTFCALCIMWLCLVKHHENLIDIFFLILISTILTISSTLHSFDGYFHRKRYFIYLVIGTIVSYYFLIVWNLIPAIRTIWYIHNFYTYMISIIYCICIVFSPSVFVYSLYQKKRIIGN